MPEAVATSRAVHPASRTTEEATVALVKSLIARRSVTPHDGGCQELIAARLSAAGFTCETVASGDVTNLWARRGAVRPVFVFAGHTDVVPTGPLDRWQSDPFVPQPAGVVTWIVTALDLADGHRGLLANRSASAPSSVSTLCK